MVGLLGVAVALLSMGLAIQKIWRADFKAGNESKSLMSGRDFAWQVNGPPTRLRAKSMVNGIMSQARSGAASRRREREQPPAKQVEQGPPRVRGHGTYLYPHVWIGERPSVPFPERLRQAAFQPPQFMALMARIPTVLHEKHAGLTFTASQDGFVTVSIEPRNEALRFLNILMALLTLEGAPALAVRDEELGEVAVDARTGDVGSSNMRLILPRMLPAYPADIPYVRTELTRVLSIEDLRSTVEVAVRSSSDKTASDLLVLFGQLYTHFQVSQYAETVLLTVSLFERAALDLKDSTGQPWRDPVAAFHSIFEMSDRMLNDFLKLRSLRSKVIHAGSLGIERAEGEAAVSLARELLRMLGRFPIALTTVD